MFGLFRRRERASRVTVTAYRRQPPLHKGLNIIVETDLYGFSTVRGVVKGRGTTWEEDRLIEKLRRFYDGENAKRRGGPYPK